MQSRNFRLQRVGDINWLENNYKFQAISFSIDELIVVNASRGQKDLEKFSESVQRLATNVFIPVAAGGGIRKLGDAIKLFDNGADKVILNSSLVEDNQLISDIARRYGEQSVVASIDYRLIDEQPVIYIHDGEKALSETLQEYLQRLQELGVGEILLNSIDKDGTGFGFDLTTISHYLEYIKTPLIVMGGAGNEKHLLQGLSLDGVSAVATANLFNFIGNGLPNARQYLIESGANIAHWNLS